MQAAPPGPPGLQAVTVTYAHNPAALSTMLTALFQESGWQVQASPTQFLGTIRMQVSHGERNMRVSIMPGPGGQGSGLLLMPM